MQVQPETLSALTNLQKTSSNISAKTALGTGTFFDRIVSCALERVNRKHGVSEPRGRRDGYVFRLNEKFDCCRAVNSASIKQSAAELQHGKTLEHLLHEFDVVEYRAQVRVLAGTIEKQGMGAALKLLQQPAFCRALLAISCGK